MPCISTAGASFDGGRSGRWRSAVSEGRLVARSTYRLQVTTAATARLRYRAREQPAEWVLECPVDGHPGKELTVDLDNPVAAGPYPIRLESVTLGRAYTMVRCEAATPLGGAAAVPAEIQVGGYRLQPVTVELGR